MPIFRQATDLIVEVRAELADATTDAKLPRRAMNDAWFDASVCRNCAAPLDTPYCSQCGQKAAKRFAFRDVGRETWDRVRFFELQSVRTILRLVISPGRVAREYVMGRRNAHMHPLKLLVALVAILVLILAVNQYFGHFAYVGKNDDVDRMAARVMAYANWSFSLGIVAIFAGSWSVFRKRLGYNVIEHTVLSIYCQNIILAAIIVNLLPTLIWHSPAFILWHKAASFYYIFAFKIWVVGAAYKQFFLLDLRKDWLRLFAACAIFAMLSWALLRVYAFAILWLVTGTI